MTTSTDARRVTGDPRLLARMVAASLASIAVAFTLPFLLMDLGAQLWFRLSPSAMPEPSGVPSVPRNGLSAWDFWSSLVWPTVLTLVVMTGILCAWWAATARRARATIVSAAATVAACVLPHVTLWSWTSGS